MKTVTSSSQETEVESSRTSLASRTSSRTDFEVLGLGLGLEGQVLGLGLGLEALSPRKLACPWLEDCTIFWKVKILWSWRLKKFWRLKNFLESVFSWRSLEKFLWRPFFFFFFWRALALCVLSPWPWPRAFLSLASRVSVLGKAVLGLGLGFFLCPWPWPWPRALCPRLHLCQENTRKISKQFLFFGVILVRSPCHYYDVKKTSFAFTSQKMRTHVTIVFAWCESTVWYLYCDDSAVAVNSYVTKRELTRREFASKPSERPTRN